ncbi:PREDICTED: receptor-transporting protein 3-like [Poecilia mexicana]|uniref:3CxxC-type domain-containing protein n=1 Tax=Poecilia mexicana TaxID=48701 RepID=A0A3B3XL57_9TELE|nr:PREDICTED: receptor-transporting protein 3-like [Poecilia mexicana]
MEQQEWIRIFQAEIETLNRKEHTWHLEFDESIDPNNPNMGWKKYLRKTSARFSCNSCKRSWPSNLVMVVFHMRLMNGQGTVKVRPLRQNCKRCPNAQMVKPSVESDNIQVLMENLMVKIRIKCYQEDLGEQNKMPRNLDVKSPHEPDHCEGCKLGICTKQ